MTWVERAERGVLFGVVVKAVTLDMSLYMKIETRRGKLSGSQLPVSGTMYVHGGVH